MTITSPTKILIIEDDVLIRLMLEDIIEELGHRVVGRYLNLQDGLDHASSDDLDFALLDFDLGDGTDAIPIAEALTRRGIPFAFTSETSPQVIRDFLPGAMIIGKPVTQTELMRILP